MTEEAFRRAVAEDRFLEWATFNGGLYGTPRTSTSGEGDLLLEIDAQGARSIKEIDPSSLIILLRPPSLEELVHRMSIRGDDAEHIERRVQLAKEEMELASGFSDHVVVNDDLDLTVSTVKSIILESRKARS